MTGTLTVHEAAGVLTIRFRAEGEGVVGDATGSVHPGESFMGNPGDEPRERGPGEIKF
ncbi:MAG: hypothetical protein QGG90_02795 [Nitrospinota bacterium]|jgi:hypothetical protein|nr:hypothetical protein [Nitrospinota bacterium]MDP6618347.1 hypothetical protein [Nitrospinota bacterium]|tara:strand:+ start:336 stop:509 length:174 start_codon:yes stop_codon:yes gene_type:complete